MWLTDPKHFLLHLTAALNLISLIAFISWVALSTGTGDRMMTMAMLKTVEPGSPSQADQVAAQAASRALARLSGRGCVQVEAVADHQERQTFILSATAVRLLTEVLAHLAEGRTVAVMPKDAELTTLQAADMLNVSRPYLVRLLEEKKMPFHKVGTHRRVLLQDLLEYRQRQTAMSAEAMDELTSEAQELDMGY